MPLRGSCTQSCGGTEQGAAQSRVEMAFNFPGEVGEGLNGKDFMTLSGVHIFSFPVIPKHWPMKKTGPESSWGVYKGEIQYATAALS